MISKSSNRDLINFTSATEKSINLCWKRVVIKCCRSILIVSCFIFWQQVDAQILKLPQVPNTTVEQQLEALTESNEDAETQDDSFLQSLQHFLQSPLNLNTADAAILKELIILSPIQIQNIISYRNLFGNFISI